MAAGRGRADAAHLFLQQWFNLSDPAWKRRSTIRLRCAALSVSAVAGGENVRRATWWSCDPCPGLGRIILAVPLAKVWQALRWGDYRALRTLSGVAPLTWRQAELAQSVLDRASIVLSLR
jgi:hypothetical protein